MDVTNTPFLNLRSEVLSLGTRTKRIARVWDTKLPGVSGANGFLKVQHVQLLNTPYQRNILANMVMQN